MNLAERFLSHPPGRVAVISRDRSLTFGELGSRAARWRGGLVAAGIGPGDRVAVISGNDETFVLAHLATVGAGAVTVPLNPNVPPAALASELELTRPAAVVVGAAGQEAWSGVVGDRSQVALAVDPVEIDTSALEAAVPAPVVPVTPDDPAVMLLTSGTAGTSRPAVLTHGNLNASLDAMLALPVDLRADDHVLLAVIPLFHVFGLNIVVNLGLAAGAALVLDDYHSPEMIGALVAQHGVTVLVGPPTLWRLLAAAPEVTAEQFASVQLAVSGAAKLANETRRAVWERLQLDVVEGYGLTETCAVGATAVGVAAPAGTVGRLVPGIEARIVDASGRDVLVGDPGELWLRGPMVSPGYFGPRPAGDEPTAGREPGRQPVAEPLAADGWLRTGDVAVVDDGGNLAIVDRLKDVVIVSGFNVFPGDVEAVLVAHPDVAEAGVVGRPDPDTGEAVIAHVVPVEGRTLEVSEVIEHCRRYLARYKVPRRIEIRSDLPLGMAGKVRRRQL